MGLLVRFSASLCVMVDGTIVGCRISGWAVSGTRLSIVTCSGILLLATLTRQCDYSYAYTKPCNMALPVKTVAEK